MIRRNGINVHAFCQGLGIRVRRPAALKFRREPNTIYGGRNISRMIASTSEEHVYCVLRCIQASSPNAFYGDVLYAVHRYISSHRPAEAAGALAQSFAGIDLLQLRNRAQRLALGPHKVMTKRADALAILIADHLEHREEAA